MTDHASDGQIDRLVKARWLAIGLSQSDLAEVLGAAIRPHGEDGGVRTDRADAARLTEVAEALELPVDLLRHDSGAAKLAPAQEYEPLQTLLDLRLLRAFRDLRDLRTRRMLVQLAEQMVKRQMNRNDGVG
jgi:PHD/YefM family antitoxin component YafN of YafNO toxin-antitoxin module